MADDSRRKPRQLSPEELAAIKARAAQAEARFGGGTIDNTMRMGPDDAASARAQPAIPFAPASAPVPPSARYQPPQEQSVPDFGQTVSMLEPPAPTSAVPFEAPVPFDAPVPVSPWAPNVAAAPTHMAFGAPRPPEPLRLDPPPKLQPRVEPPPPPPRPAPPPAPPVRSEPQLDAAPPEAEGAFATPKNRMHARQLQQLMVTETAELDAWAERNVAAGSRLQRADLVRMRALLMALSEALRSADDAGREAILEAWRVLKP